MPPAAKEALPLWKLRLRALPLRILPETLSLDSAKGFQPFRNPSRDGSVIGKANNVRVELHKPCRPEVKGLRASCMAGVKQRTRVAGRPFRRGDAPAVTPARRPHLLIPHKGWMVREPTCASGAYCVGERINRNKRACSRRLRLRNEVPPEVQGEEPCSRSQRETPYSAAISLSTFSSVVAQEVQMRIATRSSGSFSHTATAKSFSMRASVSVSTMGNS